MKKNRKKKYTKSLRNYDHLKQKSCGSMLVSITQGILPPPDKYYNHYDKYNHHIVPIIIIIILILMMSRIPA